VKSRGQVGSVLSGCALDDERGSRGVFQFRDQNGMPPQKVFNPGGPVVAVLELDYLWRRAAGPGEVGKIGIGCYDREPVGPAYSQILSSEVNRARPVSKTWTEPGKGPARRPTSLGDRFANVIRDLDRHGNLGRATRMQLLHWCHTDGNAFFRGASRSLARSASRSTAASLRKTGKRAAFNWPHSTLTACSLGLPGGRLWS